MDDSISVHGRGPHTDGGSNRSYGGGEVRAGRSLKYRLILIYRFIKKVLNAGHLAGEKIYEGKKLHR